MRPSLLERVGLAGPSDPAPPVETSGRRWITPRSARNRGRLHEDPTASRRLQADLDRAAAPKAPAPPPQPRRRIIVRQFRRDADGLLVETVEWPQSAPEAEVHILEAAALVHDEVVVPVLKTVGELLDNNQGHVLELNRLLGNVADALKAQEEQIEAMAKRIEALEARDQ